MDFFGAFIGSLTLLHPWNETGISGIPSVQNRDSLLQGCVERKHLPGTAVSFSHK